MPSQLRVLVEKARDLPIMDRNPQSHDASTDAFVEVRLRISDEETLTNRTPIVKKSLNPVWKSSEFLFEILKDHVLQDGPLEFKVMDQDLYSTETIGTVFVDLNPLIMRTAYGADVKDQLMIDGWYPIVDNSQGISRGYLKVVIKLQFIGNDNQFRDSSAGVQFFSSSTLAPHCFIIQDCIGLVVDLVVEEDPEESWQDYFRNAMKSSNLNDSRLKLLYNLSAMVQREVGKKVLEAGGNAVLGYRAQFDMEGASRLVARGYGTACRLLKVGDIFSGGPPSSLSSSATIIKENSSRFSDMNRHKHQGILSMDQSLAIHHIQDMNVNYMTYHQMRSELLARASDPVALMRAQSNDGLVQILPLKSFVTTNEKLVMIHEKNLSSSSSLFSGEVHLLSLKYFSSLVDIRLGGVVMARSVKYLGKLEATRSDQETREGWWEELREEIKSHAKVLCCSHVIGYSETCTLSGDVCVLTAIGTAAVVRRASHPSAILQLTSSDDIDDKVLNRGESMTGSKSFVKSIKDSGVIDGGRNTIRSTHEIEESVRLSTRSSTLTRDREDYEEFDDDDDKDFDTVSKDRSNSQPSGTKNKFRASQPITSYPSMNSGLENNSKRKFLTKKSLSQRSFQLIMETPMSSYAPQDYISTQEITSGRKVEGNTTLEDLVPSLQTTPVPVTRQLFRCTRTSKNPASCTIAHLPYHHKTAPFAFMRLAPCLQCQRKWVPETLLSTIEPPKGLEVRGKGVFLEARVCRSRKSGTGESDAVKISEVLPFVEYDLQRQLMFKLKVLGMNAAFGITNDIQVGRNLVAATTTCTAMYVEALPAPPPLIISKELKDPHLEMILKDIEVIANRHKSDLESALTMKLNKIQKLKKLKAEHKSTRKLIMKEKKSQAVRLQGYNNNNNISPRSNTSWSAMDTINEHSTYQAESNTMEQLLNSNSGIKGDEVITNISDIGGYESTSSSSSSSSSSGSLSSSSTTSTSSTSDGEESSLESPESDPSTPSDEGDSDNDDTVGKKTENEVNTEIKDSVDTLKVAKPSNGSKKSSNSRFQTVDSDDVVTSNNTRRRSLSTTSNPGPVNNATSVNSVSGINISSMGFVKPNNKARVEVKPKRIRMKRGIFTDDRPPYVLEVGEETDADISAVIHDWQIPEQFDVTNLSFVPGANDGSVEFTGKPKIITIFERGNVLQSKAPHTKYSQIKSSKYSRSEKPEIVPNQLGLSQMFTDLFKSAYDNLCNTALPLIPCQLKCVKHSVNLVEDDFVEIMIIAMAHTVAKSELLFSSEESILGRLGPEITQSASQMSSYESIDLSPPKRTMKPESLIESSTDEDMPYLQSHKKSNESSAVKISSFENTLRRESSDSQTKTPIEDKVVKSSTLPSQPASLSSSPVHTPALFLPTDQSLSNNSTSGRQQSGWFNKPSDKLIGKSKVDKSNETSFNYSKSFDILLSPLEHIPDRQIKRYFGPLQLHFVKDSWTARGSVSLDLFTSSFIEEATHMAKAHVAALGGNALLCYKLEMQEPGRRMSSRSHSYSLISIRGDVVSFVDSPNNGLNITRQSSIDIDTMRGVSNRSGVGSGMVQRERGGTWGSWDGEKSPTQFHELDQPMSPTPSKLKT